MKTSSYSQMERDPKIPPKQRDNLGIITRSGEHLLGLINSVLEMSKIEAGQTVYQPAPFDLWQMLRGIEEIDAAAATVTVRAGTTLQEIQQAVADAASASDAATSVPQQAGPSPLAAANICESAGIV